MRSTVPDLTDEWMGAIRVTNRANGAWYEFGLDMMIKQIGACLAGTFGGESRATPAFEHRFPADFISTETGALGGTVKGASVRILACGPFDDQDLVIVGEVDTNGDCIRGTVPCTPETVQNNDISVFLKRQPRRDAAPL